MKREIIKIKTPTGKNEIVLKSFLTARENKKMLKSIGIDVLKSGEGLVEALGIKKILELQYQLIEMYLVSVDGKKRNAFNRLLDLRSSDFDFVRDRVNQISKVNLE